MHDPVTPRPAELDGTPRRDLLDVLDRHEHVLVLARAGVGSIPEPEELRAASLGALAAGSALAAAATRWSWLAAFEALEHGAGLVDVATAAGQSVPDLLTGLRECLRGQVEHAGMAPAVADALHALLDVAVRRGGAR